MQTSGTFPQLSDGVRKTVVTAAPVVKRPAPVAKVKASTHRAGGHGKRRA